MNCQSWVPGEQERITSKTSSNKLAMAPQDRTKKMGKVKIPRNYRDNKKGY